MQLAIATQDGAEAASRGVVAEDTWQTEAIEHSRRAMIEEEHALRAALADWLASLTGCRVTLALIAVDRDARTAFLALDGAGQSFARTNRPPHVTPRTQGSSRPTPCSYRYVPSSFFRIAMMITVWSVSSSS